MQVLDRPDVQKLLADVRKYVQEAKLELDKIQNTKLKEWAKK